MVAQAINLVILTAMFFVAGMIKPKWPLFFMEKPSRFLIMAISTILFMISATMYGEGHREAKKEQAAKEALAKPQAPVPVPVPQAPAATQPAVPQKTAP